MQIQITQQKPADKIWLDESGNAIPYNRVTAYERTAEKELSKAAKTAISIHNQMVAFKKELKVTIVDLYKKFCDEHNNGKPLGKGKGNVTLFNFDRSIKVNVSVNDNIDFDGNFISLAKQQLDELLTEGLDGAKDFIKPIIMDAFTNSKGELDKKQILGLRKHESRVNHPKYSEAMRNIDKAIRIVSSSEYFQVWVKDSEGKYNDVILQFSSIRMEG